MPETATPAACRSIPSHSAASAQKITVVQAAAAPWTAVDMLLPPDDRGITRCVALDFARRIAAQSAMLAREHLRPRGVPPVLPLQPLYCHCSPCPTVGLHECS